MELSLKSANANSVSPQCCFFLFILTNKSLPCFEGCVCVCPARRCSGVEPLRSGSPGSAHTQRDPSAAVSPESCSSSRADYVQGATSRCLNDDLPKGIQLSGYEHMFGEFLKCFQTMVCSLHPGPPDPSASGSIT